MEYNKEFQEKKYILVQGIEQQGIRLLGERELQYGVQLVFEDESYVTIKVNLYASSKGFSCTASKESGAIYDKIAPLLEAFRHGHLIQNCCYLGTDESGKGDYFGPLVVAGVCSDKETDESLYDLGVKDSKKLNDSKIKELAQKIRQQLPERYVVKVLLPEQYNEEFSECLVRGRKSNAVLGDCHAYVMKELLLRFPKTELAIIDQFAEESEELQKVSESMKGHLKMYPRAEIHAAVAAASILARDAYLKWLEEAGKELGFPLEKGCDSEVIYAAIRLVRQVGAEGLKKYVKIHFKTTGTVLSESKNYEKYLFV